jgi:hypothetical protein
MKAKEANVHQWSRPFSKFGEEKAKFVCSNIYISVYKSCLFVLTECR